MAPNPPWSDLPPELLSTIANFLSLKPLDILSFRSVCKSWHSSSRNIPHCPFPLFLPLVIPSPPVHFMDPPQRNVLSLTILYSLHTPENPLVQVRPNTWICFLDEWNKDKLSVRKPLSSERWPRRSYSSPINFPKSLNMLDFHASEVSRFHNFVYVHDSNNGGIVCPDEVLKVIVLSNMSAVIILCRYGRLYTMNLREGELEDKQQWQTIHDVKGFPFDDIVEFKNTVLGVDRRGRLYEIGLDKYPVTFDLIVGTSTGGGGRRKRLVESLGELYLVARCNVNGEGVALKVYQLLFNVHKARRWRWRPVTEIGDRVFFIDLQFSFSASTQQLGGVYRNNCIIYNQQSFQKNVIDTDEDFHKYDKYGFCQLEDPSNISMIDENASNFEVFWPPPSWVFLK